MAREMLVSGLTILHATNGVLFPIEGGRQRIRIGRKELGMRRLISLFGCAAVILAAQSLYAEGSADARIAKALKGVSTLELPAKASSLVEAATLQNKQSVALAVLRASVALNPSATPSVVAAIARSTPSVALEVVTAANKLQPKQADLITAAAGNAALGGPNEPGSQPPNPRGTGNGKGGGDGNGHGQGKAGGHTKNYAQP